MVAKRATSLLPMFEWKTRCRWAFGLANFSFVHAPRPVSSRCSSCYRGMGIESGESSSGWLDVSLRLRWYVSSVDKKNASCVILCLSIGSMGWRSGPVRYKLVEGTQSVEHDLHPCVDTRIRDQGCGHHVDHPSSSPVLRRAKTLTHSLRWTVQTEKNKKKENKTRDQTRKKKRKKTRKKQGKKKRNQIKKQKEKNKKKKTNRKTKWKKKEKRKKRKRKRRKTVNKKVRKKVY